MAMRERGASVASAARQRLTRHTYEDFHPPSELKEDERAHVLLLSLPGFTKEQIKVSVDKEVPVLTVEGRRFLPSNKWSRFKKIFPIPRDTVIEQIRAKFEGGKLFITIPKKPTEPKNEAQLIQRTPPPENPERPRTIPQEITKPTMHRPDTPPTSLQKPVVAVAPIQHKEAVETLMPKPSPLEKPIEAHMAPEGLQPKPSIPTSPEKPTTATVKPQGVVEETPTSTLEAKNGDMMKAEVKEADSEERANKMEGLPNNEVAEEGRGGRRNVANEDVTGTVDRNGAINKYKQVAADVTMAVRGGGEDRQLLMNVGAGLLVAVAFGAYVSYGLWSFGKPEI